MINPLCLKEVLIGAAIAGVVGLVTGFGSGWQINGWRLGGKIMELEGVVATQNQSIDTLKGANERCTAGVNEVRTSVKGYIDEADRRANAATKAMAEAAAAAKGHLDAAKNAMNRPPAPPGKECDTAAAEASSYAKKRKGGQ